jgi:hypothetical protein
MGRDVVSIFGFFATITVIAVLVSTRAQTQQIIQSIGSATSGVINSAVSPLNTKQGG